MAGCGWPWSPPFVPTKGDTVTITIRRRRGEGGISFEHRGSCRDPQRPRHCPGLWRGEITLGATGDGKRARREVSSATKAVVVEKLRDLHHQLDKGITPRAGYIHYTVRQAAQDWLAHGLDGRSPKTVTKNQNVLEPILTVIGARKLRYLTAADVRQALATLAAGVLRCPEASGHLSSSVCSLMRFSVSVTSPGVLSIGQSCSARGGGLAGGRGSRPGEGQDSTMSTCLVAVKLPRAAPT